MNKIVTLGFSLLLSLGALVAQKIDYDISSKWFMGFNIGGTWQTTDVANRTSAGWGMTLGRSFNYNYGKRVSFDLRGRYLGGYWYGQDFGKTDLPTYTGTILKHYKDSLGFSVNNFQTELHSLSMELVLHANGVRERSGWDPYIFGGVGVKWHQTFGDLYANDSLGDIYNYDPSTLSKTYISSLTDGIYETALEGSKADKFSVSVMPSLGFGIGYQVGKRVTLGLEHKTTFTGADNFDGFIADSKYKQDLYHYTSFYVNWHFKARHGGGGTSGGTGVNNLNNNNNTNNLTGCISPVISYISPATAGLNVSTINYLVTADIKDVIGKENITFKHNGLNTLNFTYNPTTDRFEAPVILTAGSNTFEIYATNTCGSDTEGLNVNYQNCLVPVISMVNPTTNNISVNNSNFVLSALIQNVDNAQGISLKVNNQGVSNYNYNTVSGSLQSNLILLPGLNTIVITTTNACGTDVETMNVTYQNCVSPVINVVNPATNGTTVNQNAYTFNALVQNVNSAQGLTLKHNGTSITNFSFNTTSGALQSGVTLSPGLNTFVVTATNACGTDTKTVTINYTRELNNSGNNGGGNQNEKITICHYPPGNNGNPQTLEIPLSAWPAHQAHGDKLGPCEPGTGNGNNGGNGNNNGGGNQNEKITICHYPPGNNGNPQTLEIPLSAWPAHQAHGDKLGPCEPGTGNGNNGGGNQNEKITICHYPPGNNGNPQTLEIPLSAWPAHQAHGDKLGPCEPGNGNNGGNGNTGGGNGNSSNGNSNGGGSDQNGSTGSGSTGNTGGGNTGGGNGNSSSGNSNGGGSDQNGSTGSGSTGNTGGGNTGGGNGNSSNGNGNGGGSDQNGSTGSGSTGNAGGGNTGGGNGNSSNGNGNGGGSDQNGSTGSGSTGNTGGGNNKSPNTTGKPNPKPVGPKATPNPKPGIVVDPVDPKGTKPSGSDSKQGNNKPDTLQKKAPDFKPGVGGGKGGKQ